MNFLRIRRDTLRILVPHSVDFLFHPPTLQNFTIIITIISSIVYAIKGLSFESQDSDRVPILGKH